MPFYDYQCKQCGSKVELQHGIHEEAIVCPKCQLPDLKRVFSTPPAFHDRYSPMHPRAGRGRGGQRGLPT